MSALSDLKMYGRFIFGLPGFLRRRMTVEEAREAIRRGLAARDDNFPRSITHDGHVVGLRIVPKLQC